MGFLLIIISLNKSLSALRHLWSKRKSKTTTQWLDPKATTASKKILMPVTLDDIHRLPALHLHPSRGFMLSSSCENNTFTLVTSRETPSSNSHRNNLFKHFSPCSLRKWKSKSSFYRVKNLLFAVTGLTHANLMHSPLLPGFTPRTFSLVETLTKWAISHLFPPIALCFPFCLGCPEAPSWQYFPKLLLSTVLWETSW